MIRGGEVLLALAQIAIALAGFSGVVAAFGRGGALRVEDRVRFLMLFGSAFVGIFLCFVPFFFTLGGMEDPELWRWSSGVWLLVSAASAPLLSWGRKVILRSGRAAPGWSVVLVLLVALGATAAQMGNIASWPFAPGPLPFIFGLMAGMLGSGVIFVYLVLMTPARL